MGVICLGHGICNLVFVVKYIRQVTHTLSEKWKAEDHAKRKWAGQL